MSTSEIINELKQLRRGRGLQADNLHQLVKSHLRRACNIDDADPPGVVRDKLVLRLTELCGRLSVDLQAAALAALALHEEANQRFLHERMAWLKGQLNRDSERTSRRWIDTAFQRLAELLDDQNTWPPDHNHSRYAPGGWYVETLTSVLNLTGDRPQLTETRQIVATADELDEIVISLSAPKGDGFHVDDKVTVMMGYGGKIVESEYDASGHSRFVVRLPQPLSLGERHTYNVQFTAYPQAAMKPYYVLLPLRVVKQFRVHIRFDPENLPQQVWRLSGVPPVVLEQNNPNSDLLTIDPVGEISLEFFDSREGLGYGAAWQ